MCPSPLFASNSARIRSCSEFIVEQNASTLLVGFDTWMTTTTTPATTAMTAIAAATNFTTPIVASTDDLPAFGPVAKPKRSRVGPIPRTRGPLTDVGTSKEVVRALFDELAPGAVADRIYAADGNYVLVQLVTRDLPDEKVFDKDAARRIAQLRDLRGEELVNAWLKDRCDALAKDDKIKPAASLLRQEDEKGNALPPSSRVCEF